MYETPFPKRKNNAMEHQKDGIFAKMNTVLMCGIPYKSHPRRRLNILTVAMPGNASGFAQLARYTAPEDGVLILDNGPLKKEIAHSYHNKNRLDKRHNRHESNSAFKILFNTFRRLWSCRVVEEEEEKERKDNDFAYMNEDVEEEDIMMDSYSPLLYHATSHLGVRLLHNILPSPEVAEVVHCRSLLSDSSYYSLFFSFLWSLLSLWNPFYWILISKGVLASFYFGNRPVEFYYVEFGRTNLGGLTDQRSFLRNIKRAVRLIEMQTVEKGETRSRRLPNVVESIRLPLDYVQSSTLSSGKDEILFSLRHSCNLKTHLVLFGCSRGATTCFYTSMKLPCYLAAYVSLIILEAPFDTLEHVIQASSWFPSLARFFFNSFCDYHGKNEETMAYSYDPKQVYLRCPVAFILSKRDSRVPNGCSETLIHQLRAHFVPHQIPAVEVLILENSRHPCMAVGNQQDQEKYVAFVEKLYSTYCV
ncbi:unnamed protein product [Phytomonas sp. Hart1]|nr:unnamed protein product [Phytomonas sp. Hart1]|eukprot:CCW66204.1 unnamed protein product [Phytomonas sp. isolate Hart1]